VQAGGPPGVHLNEAQREASSSVARLSSGNAIVRASDDVAGLSVSTGLQTRITSIRSSLINALQASSLLQVADGALNQQQEVLERMNAIATQAGAGSMTDTERSFLDLEFQNLKAEINRISETTNFNGVTVLKADAVDATKALKIDDSIASKASASINFTSNPANNQTFVMQGLTFRFVTAAPTSPLQIQLGATVKDTVTNMLSTITSYSQSDPVGGLRIDEALFERQNDLAFSITSKTGGELSQFYTIDLQASSARANFDLSKSINASDNANGSFILSNNNNGGIGAGDTKAEGITSGGLVSAQSQDSAQLAFAFTGIPSTGERIFIDDGGAGGQTTFTFVVGTPATNTEIEIGATISDTIDNAIKTLTEFPDSAENLDSLVPRQLEYLREDDNLVVRYKGAGNPTDFTETIADIGELSGVISLPSGAFRDALDTGTNSGFNTQGVINADFVGKIDGFEAEYVSADRLRLSLTVGDSEYSASFNTDFTTNQIIRMNSDDGGYFEIVFNAAENKIENQGDADIFAKLVDQAIEGLTFFQERNISSFVGADLLKDTTLDIRLDDFSEPIVFEELNIRGFDENQSGTNTSASMEVIISGERFRSISQIDEQITGYQQIVLQSIENPNRTLTFTNDGNEIDIKTTADVEALTNAFLTQLPIGEKGSGTQTIAFQIDEGNSSQLKYVVETTSTDTLFDDADSVSVATAELARDAFVDVKEAIATLTSRRAYVGALQSQSDYIFSTLESSVIVHEAARGVIADTDISSESTAFVQSQVRIQAAIAVGAQANVLKSTVLDIVEASTLGT